MAVALASVVGDRIAGATALGGAARKAGRSSRSRGNGFIRGISSPVGVRVDSGRGGKAGTGSAACAAGTIRSPAPWWRHGVDPPSSGEASPASGSTPRRGSVKRVPARFSWVLVVVSSFTGLVSLDTSVVRVAHAGPPATAEQEGGSPTRVATGRPGRWGARVARALHRSRAHTTPPVERWGGKERPGTSGSWPWPLTRVAFARLDREEGASRQRRLRPTSERRFGRPSQDGGRLLPVTDVSEGGFAVKVPLSSRERRGVARPLVPNLVTMPARRHPTEVSLVKNGRCFRDPQRANAKALEGYDGHDDGASPAG